MHKFLCRHDDVWVSISKKINRMYDIGYLIYIATLKVEASRMFDERPWKNWEKEREREKVSMMLFFFFSEAHFLEINLSYANMWSQSGIFYLLFRLFYNIYSFFLFYFLFFLLSTFSAPGDNLPLSTRVNDECIRCQFKVFFFFLFRTPSLPSG